MRMISAVAALALPWAGLHAQHVKAARFAGAEAYASPRVAIAQPTPQCRHSVLRFAGQFLAGTGTGALAGYAFARVGGGAKTYGDYRLHGDSYGSTTFLKRFTVATAVGAAAGVWISAPRQCRAVVPSLIGAGLAAIPLRQLAEKDASAIAGAAMIVVGIPLQALSATIAQTLAR